MVKCVVTGCPNRLLNVNRDIFHRPTKRFFNFPKDPTRVKVWLAALRETDKQDSSDQHLICEDHFLPDDISATGVNNDAIPIMPPYLDGSLGMISPWGVETSEDEDQWATACGDEDEGDDEDGVDVPAYVEPPAPKPPQKDPGGGLQNPSVPKMTGVGLKQSEVIPSKKASRQDVSLGQMTRRFLEVLLVAPDGPLDLGHMAASLQTRRRRVYDITNILEGLDLIHRSSKGIKWIGNSPISRFLWKNEKKFEKELENLKLVESTLDGLIKTCAQQLFDMTDDTTNTASAYVTHEDIRRLQAFQEQTVIVVKAPEETKLEIPTPTEDGIQVHLKGGRGPIIVRTCDIGTGRCFMALEESRIKTATLHTGRSSTSQPPGGASCPPGSNTFLGK